ncbi:MAG: PmoA family protein [Thermoguttaceae bacterium]
MTMKRRDFVKTSLAMAGGALAGSAMLGREMVMAGPLRPMGGEVPEKHLTAYVVDPSAPDLTYQAWIRRNNEVLTSYRAFGHQKYPYFYPVAGPVTGLSLTSETTLPWPHHRSLFFGMDRVNGGNYWQGLIKDGQVLSQGVKLGDVTETSAQVIDGCIWKKPTEEPILIDKRLFELRLIDGTPNYVIDADIELTSLVDVKVQKTNHGLFGVRTAPDLRVDAGGTLITSEGNVGEKETLGKPARWCTFYGKRAASEHVEGVAVMIHPKYPNVEQFPTFKDCPWFTRDYGNCSPMPLNFVDNPLTLPKGESIHLKYRVVAYSGSPTEAKLDSLWEEFAKS